MEQDTERQREWNMRQGDKRGENKRIERKEVNEEDDGK